MNSIPATPAKLKDGSWGARAQSETVSPGDIVTITTRAGKSWDASVSQVLWHGDGMALCATQSLDRPSAPSRRRGRSCSCDADCCRGGCRCDAHCACLGGPIYDCDC